MIARQREEVDRAQALSGPGLATADDCDDGEEVSRAKLRYPKHLMSCTIALAHTLTPSHTVRCLDRDTAGDCIGRAVLSGLSVSCVCLLRNEKKQKARPKGVNLKVR